MDLLNHQRRLLLRFMSRLVIPKDREACWEWTAGAKDRRYGSIRDGARQKSVHVLSYEFFVAPVPSGMQVLHTCDHTRCVNPRHLFVGTQADNIADKVEKGRQAKGITQWNAHLTDEQVIAIMDSREKAQVLADRYHVCYSTIARIRQGRSWRHLTRSA